MEVPRYKELSVSNLWPLVSEVPELIQYFPKFQPNQLPDRDYMNSILATFRNVEFKTIILNARKNRSLKAPESDENFIHINKKLYDEINAVSNQQRKKSNLILRK